MKIAEALVLRKHLDQKVEQLKPLKMAGDNGLFEVKTERTKISDEVDEIKFQLPKVELKEVTKEYDLYSKALRELDTAIQQANWTAEVDFKTPSGVNVQGEASASFLLFNNLYPVTGRSALVFRMTDLKCHNCRPIVFLSPKKATQGRRTARHIGSCGRGFESHRGHQAPVAQLVRAQECNLFA